MPRAVDRLPATGRIDVVRSTRSNRDFVLFGTRITLGAEHTLQHVTAIITVRTRTLIVIDTNGEIIHDTDPNRSGELR